MIAETIIWDFDGTLYPLQPYDSEQTLLLLCLKQQIHPEHVLKRRTIRMLIYADRQQWFTGKSLRKIYGLLYGWCLKGMHVSLLDKAAERIAATIPPGDKEALQRFHSNGFRMLVISCGTLDLSERILTKAGIRECFESVQANPLRIQNDLISGLTLQLITAEDKLQSARKLVKGSPQSVMAVGDGYTDVPLLDWVEFPVMMDHDNDKRLKYASKPYCFISSIESLQKRLTQVCCISKK